jgi:hypothetical protein
MHACSSPYAQLLENVMALKRTADGKVRESTLMCAIGGEHVREQVQLTMIKMMWCSVDLLASEGDVRAHFLRGLATTLNCYNYTIA